MSSPSNIVVKVSRQIPFSAERVFDAWLDAKFAAFWATHTRCKREYAKLLAEAPVAG